MSSVHCLLAVLGVAESSEGDADTRLRPSSDKRDLFCSCENVAHDEEVERVGWMTSVSLEIRHYLSDTPKSSGIQLGGGQLY